METIVVSPSRCYEDWLNTDKVLKENINILSLNEEGRVWHRIHRGDSWGWRIRFSQSIPMESTES